MPPRSTRNGSAPVLVRVITLVIALVIALGLAACGGSDGGSSSGTESPSSADAPEQGGTMTLSYLAEPSSLDPAVAWNVIDRQIVHDIYQGMLRYDPKPGDAGKVLIPCLAAEVPSVENGGISTDGRTYTFHLRKGVKFQPPVSREVTAQDFKYSFERMMTTPRAPGISFYTDVVGASAFIHGKASEISGFRAVDDYTVEITLNAPNLSFLDAFAMEFCDVVPREWVDKWGTEFDRHPLGTGPFIFEKWSPGREVVLTRNPLYWEPGKPHLDKIDYQLSFPPPAALLELQSGEIDALGDGVPPADFPRVTADPQWKQYVYTQPLIATSYMFMNVQMKPLDNVKVRRALSWAIDRHKLVQLQAGQAVTLWQFYPNGLPGHEEGKVFYGYDPRKARRLLSAAGYPNGFRTILYTDNVDPDPALWRSVQADLAAVGVTAELRTMSDSALYGQSSTPRTLTAGSIAWYMDIPDPSDWIGPLFSKASAVPGGMNASFWWSPKLEVMFKKAQAMTDPAARIAKFSEMQQLIADQAPYVPCYQPVQTSMCSKNTGGFFLHPVYQIDPTQYWKK